MSDAVKPPRRYDASRRREQAGETRSHILACALRLFLANGYADTAIPEIARGAGVSVPTVYKAFPNKATLLKSVFDVSIAGDDDATPMAERDVIDAVRAEPDAARKIRMYTAHLADIAPRTVPLQLVARAAAGADSAAAAVWAQMRAEMLTAMTFFTADLQATGQLRADASADEVRDVLWTYHSPEIYDLLVVERGWSAGQYGTFIGQAMIDAVLAEGV
ncbi:MAG: TetR family transcriptional regulator [Mycobacterium sp.]|nr:TetR family transcriptional regulator [Mycobacterium sp.]